MGNQIQTVSRFSDRHQWLTVAKTNFKELIQNKLTREIVEVHRLPEVQADHLRHESLVYQWRNDPKTIMYIIQIFEINHNSQEENKNCIGACQMSTNNSDLVVYTQNLLKLYEMNSKIQLTEGDQIGIFKDIIEGIDMLSQKFGQFIPSKDSVGFNARKRGKAWINDNFCCNNLQQKRLITSKQERICWQNEVIQALIDIFKLCTTQNNYKNNKFYFLLEAIRKNKINKFSTLKQFKGPERIIAVEAKNQPFKAPAEVVPNVNNAVQLENSQNILSSKEFVTTKDLKQKLLTRQEYKRINKTFDVPSSSSQDKQIKNIFYQTTYNNQTPQQVKFIDKKAKVREFSQIHQPPQPSKNHINVKKNKIINNTVGSYANIKANALNRPVYQQKRQGKQKPAHYAILQELQDSRSSRSQSKMIKRQTIQMIDSVQLVQNRHDYEHSSPYYNFKNTILEESIILKAPKR